MTIARSTNRPESFVKMLSDYLTRREMNIHHAMPGKIESYDSSTCTASVKPLIMRHVSDEIESEELDVLNDVKVIFPSSKNASISFPLERGDNVLVLFNDFCIDEWRAGNGEQLVKASDGRQHHLSDAVCIPGCFPTASQNIAKDQNSLVVKYKDSALQITADGTVKIGDETGTWQKVATEDFVKDVCDKLLTGVTGHQHTGTIALASGATSGTCTTNLLTGGLTPYAANPTYTSDHVQASVGA